MIEKIEERLSKEIENLLSKEELTSKEVRILLDVKNDLKLDEKMKKMMQFAA